MGSGAGVPGPNRVNSGEAVRRRSKAETEGSPEAVQVKCDEALAASRRLEAQVAELEGVLRKELQELRGTTQEFQGEAREQLQGAAGQAAAADEAVRRLQQDLQALEDLARGELQPELRIVKEKQATDFLRLTRELKEIQAFLQAMRTAGASATARCLSCFSAKYQESNKILMGADGKVYKRRPMTPTGTQQQPPPEGPPIDAWGANPMPGAIPVGSGRSTPAQGAPGASLRKVRSDRVSASPAATASAAKRHSPSPAPELPECVEGGSMLSTQGGVSPDASRQDPLSAGDSFDGPA